MIQGGKNSSQKSNLEFEGGKNEKKKTQNTTIEKNKPATQSTKEDADKAFQDYK